MANGDRQVQMGQALAAGEASGEPNPGRQALESLLVQSGDQGGGAPASSGGQPAPARHQVQTNMLPGGQDVRDMTGGDIVAELAQRAQGGGQQGRGRREGLGPVEGPQDTVERRLRRLQASRLGQTRPGRAFQEELSRTFVDNVMQTPTIIGDLLAAGSAGIRSMWGVGSDFAEGGFGQVGQGLVQRFSNAFPEEQQQLPARALREVGQQAPSSTDLQAGVARTGQMLSGEEGPDFQELQTQFEDRRLQQMQEQPGATEMGGALGDAATILAGRSPVARRPRREAMEQFQNPRSSVPANPRTELPPGIRKQVRQSMEGDLMQTLRTGSRQVGGASLEGSIVAMLNDGDPAQMATFAGGAEATRNLLVGGSRHILSNPAGIGGALLAGTALWQMMQSGTPGGNDYILESFETSADKMTATLALGGLSVVLGGAKPSRGLQENIPLLADAVQTVPRNIVNSLANSFLSYDTPASEDVDAAFQQFVRDPNAFGRTARRRIERSFQREGGDPRAEIESLMENSPQFVERLEELRSPEGAEP